MLYMNFTSIDSEKDFYFLPNLMKTDSTSFHQLKGHALVYPHQTMFAGVYSNHPVHLTVCLFCPYKLVCSIPRKLMDGIS